MASVSHSHLFTQIERQLAVVTLLANFAGALLTFVYFQVLAPLPTGVASVGDLPPAAVLGFAGLMALTFAVGGIVGNRVTRGITEWFGRVRRGASSGDIPIPIARQALSYGIRSAGVSFAMWLLAALLSAVWFSANSPADGLRVFLTIAGTGGVLTSAIVYFAIDLFWRQAIPIFFPDGKLSVIRAFRLPVLGRLLIVFSLVGLWPLAILVSLSLQRARALVGAPNPETILENLFVLELFILGVSVFAGVGMAIFVTRSIVGPLRTLQAAMARVEQHDFTVQVPVTTNDELGYLGERFNDMVAGLRQGEMLRNLLNLYVSPEVAREVVLHGARLGGKLVECSVLFSDIRDFTGLAERLPPADLIALLNRYMAAMVAVVVEHGGMVNKFGGDSLLAVFGTPLNPAEDHAEQAVRAALGMRHGLAEFNRGQEEVGGPTLRIGIGIATGPAVAGNIGGEERLEYTVIGDTVNLAARLQSLTKELGREILLSAETRAACRALALDAELLPDVPVRGKSEPVDVYATR